MNQHFVSKVLLKYFSPIDKKGLIYILEKLDKEQLGSIKKHAACREDYNVLLLNEDNDKSNFLEDLANNLETKIGNILDKDINKGNLEITYDAWSNIIYFGAFLFLNVPQFRNNIEKFDKQIAEKVIDTLVSNKNMLKSYIDKIDLGNMDKSKIDIDKLISFGKDKSKYNFNIPKERVILAALKQIDNLFNIMSKMDWTFFIISDDSYFVTSDTPIVPVANGWSLPFAPFFASADFVFFSINKKSMCCWSMEKRKEY